MSFEKKIDEKINDKEDIPDRVNISVLKYFWQTSPLSGKSERIIPKFLRAKRILKNFSDNELRILTNYLHHRSFAIHEAVFNQGDNGVGLYFIFSGQIDIFVKGPQVGREGRDSTLNYVTTLEKGAIFGELALSREYAIRTSTAVAKEDCELLGFFKPDMEDLIEKHPVVGAKFLQSISVILATRLSTIASEMKALKHKVLKLERGE